MLDLDVLNGHALDDGCKLESVRGAVIYHHVDLHARFPSVAGSDGVALGFNAEMSIMCVPDKSELVHVHGIIIRQ